MGKTLRADIIIGGKADGSFFQLGNDLEKLGSQVNQISEKLIQFGKESVDAYVSYEDYMLEAMGALSTQYESANELNRAMGELTDKGMEWASASRFTTEDVAAAISDAAHAGWNLEEILSGVPEAMNIALAGNMDMAQGLEYLVDITNAAGLSFDELGDLVDYWAYAANRSSTNIPEMGAAMQKMGATMQFVKGDVAGLTTMLAVLANNGAKGTEAGTLLRNAMIRVIAPTKAAAEAMDMLGVSETELDEIYSNATGIENANKLLEEAGFSAYDSQGNLKSFMEIWQELAKATDSMTEQQRNDILTTIFPTRTITGALALMEAARKSWDGLYGDILKYGPGYADYLSSIIESGLGGKLRHVGSVYQALQTRVGESLSEDVGGWAEELSGLIENINNMDDVAFDSTVAGLEAIAAAGPGLLAAGGAIKFLFLALSNPATGLVAISAAAAALNEFNEAMYDAQFGTLELDNEKLREYMVSIGSDFAGAAENIDKYNQALETAITTYQGKTSELKSGLITAMVTDAELTKEDFDTFYALGEDIRTSVIDGIKGNYSAAGEILGFLSGASLEELGSGEDGIAKSIMDLLASGYNSAIEQANSLSEQLRKAMFSAFADGKISQDETSNITSILNDYNKLLAEQTSAQNRAKLEVLTQKMQSLGADGMAEATKIANEAHDLMAEEAYAWEERLLGDLFYSQESQGLSDSDIAEEKAWIQNQAKTKLNAAAVDKNRLIFETYERAIMEGDLSDAYAYANKLADMVIGGYLDPVQAYNLSKEKFGANFIAGDKDLGAWDTGSQLGQFLARTIGAMGGQEEVANQIRYLESTGEAADAAFAAQLRTIYAAEGIVNNFAKTSVMEGTLGGFWDGNVQTSAGVSIDRLNMGAFLDVVGSAAVSIEQVSAETAKALIAENRNASEWMQSMTDAAYGGNADIFDQYDKIDADAKALLASVTGQLKDSYDFQKLLEMDSNVLSAGVFSDEYAAWRLMYDSSINAEDYRRMMTPGTNLESLGLGEETGITIPVDGDAEGLRATIAAEDGKSITVNVLADADAVGAEISKYDGMSIGVNINPRVGGVIGLIAGKLFAEGGRATEASIFGEAGPEWAIPEEHSQRTADLLASAAMASGFTWPELLTRNGGLNAGGGSWTIVYSPTIVAADSNGVEQKLAEDKKRFEKWFRDKQLRDSLEVYQ